MRPVGGVRSNRRGLVSRRRALVFFAVVACLVGGLGSAALADKKIVVAVFEIQTRRVRMGRQLKGILRDLIETEMTRSGQYAVVPPGQLRRALSKQKNKSYRQCYAQRCQISIGQELAADRTLSTRVSRVAKSVWSRSSCTTSSA